MDEAQKIFDSLINRKNSLKSQFEESRKKTLRLEGAILEINCILSGFKNEEEPVMEAENCQTKNAGSIKQ